MGQAKSILIILNLLLSFSSFGLDVECSSSLKQIKKEGISNQLINKNTNSISVTDNNFLIKNSNNILELIYGL